MAEKTSQGAQLNAADQAQALAHKYHQIEAMAQLVAAEGCFRKKLVGYFEGSKKGSRRSFSIWLLEWVFAEPAKRGQKVACCDACSRRTIERRGERGHIQDILAGNRH
jgi:hypothetical protein